MRNHPGLAAARLRIEEARGRYQQAGRLPNPAVGGEYAQNVRTPERGGELSVTQQFPLTARLRLEKAVTRLELAAAEAEVRNEERKLRAQAATAVARLLAIRAQRELRETQITNSRQIAEFTRNRVAVGEASVADATLTEMETRQLETELLLLETQTAAVLGELRPLMGATPANAIEVRGGLPGLAAALGKGTSAERRPDLQAAKIGVEAGRMQVGLERARKWGDVSAGLSVQSQYMEDAPDGLQRDEFIGLRFSLPLPIWNNNAGRIREAAATAARRAREAEALALTIRSEAETARQEMAALRRVIETMDEGLIPRASQAEEQLRAAQATGQAPLTEVLRARDRRFQLERQRLEVLRDYHLARIRHEAATAHHTPAPAMTRRRTK